MYSLRPCGLCTAPPFQFAVQNKDSESFTTAIDQLRQYFLINGILLIVTFVMIGILLIFISFFSSFIMDFLNDEIKVKYIATNAAGERKFMQDMVLQFQDFEYSIIQGYFDQYEFDLPGDTILFNLFETLKDIKLFIIDLI